MAPILLVDDDADFAEAVREAMALEGHDVRVTMDGDEALRLAVSLQPRLVLVDYAIPGTDTHRLIRRLRETTRACIVLCTGMGDAAALAEKTGTDHVLEKPFRIEALLALAARVDQPVAAP